MIRGNNKARISGLIVTCHGVIGYLYLERLPTA